MGASAAIFNNIIPSPWMLCTLLLFLISDKSGNEILVNQIGIYRVGFVSKVSNKLGGGCFPLNKTACFKNYALRAWFV